jgi:lysophospholipase L1-like esterase
MKLHLAEKRRLPKMSIHRQWNGLVRRAHGSYFRCFVAVTLLVSALPLFAQGGGHTAVGRLVVVGDSLSAGFQNFSLFDSDTAPVAFAGGQKHGYAALVATQAGASLTLPLISYPGLPPALFLDASHQIERAAGFGVRENPANQTYNLSVPGFTVANAIAYPFPGSPTTNAIDAMSDSILAEGPLACGAFPLAGAGVFVSEVACAVQLRPQTILVSIGNNDALQALTSGTPPTDARTFAEQYFLFLAGLSATHAHIVVSNIPDVTAIPFLVPVPAFHAICPAPLAVPPLPSTVTNADFVVLNIENPAPPMPLSICTNYAVRSASLIAQTRTAVAEFNRIIAADARLFNATVVDVNGLFTQLAANGYDVGGHHLTTQFLGGLFSLDGIHPTNTGYAILANQTITTMNTQLHTAIPTVSVEQVAATDPLILP